MWIFAVRRAGLSFASVCIAAYAVILIPNAVYTTQLSPLMSFILYWCWIVIGCFLLLAHFNITFLGWIRSLVFRHCPIYLARLHCILNPHPSTIWFKLRWWICSLRYRVHFCRLLSTHKYSVSYLVNCVTGIKKFLYRNIIFWCHIVCAKFLYFIPSLQEEIRI